VVAVVSGESGQGDRLLMSHSGVALISHSAHTCILPWQCPALGFFDALGLTLGRLWTPLDE